MEINTLVVQLALVFLPGLVWSSVVDHLTTHTRREAFDVVTRAFVFGLLAYGIYYALYFGLTKGELPPLLRGLQGAPSADRLAALPPADIFFATVAGFVGGVFWSYALNRKWFMRLMQRLEVTRKYGDEDVWSFVFNMGSATVEYVNVRDFERKIIYCGYVKGFSESTEARELLLERVEVYDLDSAAHLFSMPLIYLSRPPDTLHIEFPVTVPAVSAPTQPAASAATSALADQQTAPASVVPGA